MIKHIIREVPAEYADFSYYFDCDCFSEKAGGFEYTLFILYNDGWGRISGINADVFNNLQIRASNMIDDFGCAENGLIDYKGNKITYKRIMQDYGINYNSAKCAKLKKWAKQDGADDVDGMANYLSIVTNHKWETTSASGYSQGDYVDIIYCVDVYKPEDAEAAGEIWLGAAKEFGVIDVDEDGKETDSCYGYIVADCQAWRDEEYKRIVCEWAGIKPEETQIEMVDGCKTVTQYSYRTA